MSSEETLARGTIQPLNLGFKEAMRRVIKRRQSQAAKLTALYIAVIASTL